MFKTLYLFGYKIVVKVYTHGSQYGIHEAPRISKMEVLKNGKRLLNYDRGWEFNYLPHHTYKWLIKIIDLIV
ncbi:DUF7678 domain-containing protein [Metabacillus bambusae]|uniref:DUF7678 domain-containing protein n=1 Tax=Metabacillus bambusae TaxID=2795218 RepID=A0ABS3NBK4_9BACI|nr:hypothetical protein [Metabacillus bambusae]MBO1515661.1 hypothetical protein [Metabacillus bambusae]